MSASRWLMRFVPRPDARLRLVCLAHAGGNAVFYRPWAHALAPAVDVVAVQLPGRLDRVAERPETDLLTAVDAIGAAIRADGGGPVALFGHSMGALLAYELARRLPAGGNPVHHLMVSGHGDPRRAARQRLHQAPAAQLWQHVISLNGTDPAVVAHPHLRDLVLPILRADYQLVEEYAWYPAPVLSCPVTAFTGTEDPEVTPAEMAQWAEETSGPFHLHRFPGDHFYLVPQRAAVLAAVTAAIDAGTRSAGIG
ncbi:alpha/beta fold hydrolase [Micromonospora sp. FIMYZ51]|uniref:thioesterase II family protein n=1 Tax=Micromonospora sp. FIMYZ51 TaxID=3051832 RepID=UPI00311DE703